MSKASGVLKNIMSKSSKSSSSDGEDQINQPVSINPSNDTALRTIINGLKLSNDKETNQYKSTDTLYDVIIRINCLSSLEDQGWEILVGKHTMDVVPVQRTTSESAEGVIATVIGAYNRGKSYLLRKLCKIDIPDGKLIHTEGISITAGRDNYKNIVFIDTAGTDTPVAREKLDFKRATDALLREVVLYLSTYFIIVVNRLRASDQTYIQQILKYCRQYPNIKKNIIIVHNLLDIETIKDADDLIRKEVVGIFEATPKETQLTMNGVIRSIKFFISKENENIELRHYVLAKSSSEAGKVWNKQSLDGIMNLLQNSENKRSLNIIKDMISYINTRLPQLFQSNQQLDGDNQTPTVEVVQHDSLPYVVLSNRRQLHDLLREPCRLKLSDKLIYDDSGYFVRNEAGRWQPRYNLYENETHYYLIAELTGFKQADLNASVLEKSIVIEGIRTDLNESIGFPIIRQSDILIGSFKLNLAFDCEIDTEEVKRERDDGFIKIIIPKKKQKITTLTL